MKKAWPAVVAASIAVVAYTQAKGISSFVSAELEEVPSVREPFEPYAEEPPPAADGTPILERNPFDSRTGALDEEDEKIVAFDDASDDDASDDDEIELEPNAPSCTFGEVTLIVASDPAYAFASITTPTEKGRFFKIGDAVDNLTVQDISWDRVWFAGADSACQMRLGDKLPRAKPAKKAKKKKRKKRKKKKKGPTPVPAHIADRIQQLGPNRYAIERSAFDAVFEMENGLVRGTKVRPVKEGDTVLGMRFTGRGVAEGSLLHSIGIRPGDVLKSVNGFSPTNPQKALEAYGRLKMADDLSLVLERDGKPTTIEYQIR